MTPDQISVSSAVLKAAAHHYGSQCDKPNKEFMLCRWEEKDPRKCLEEGRKVNECALNFFRYVSTTNFRTYNTNKSVAVSHQPFKFIEAVMRTRRRHFLNIERISTL